MSRGVKTGGNSPMMRAKGSRKSRNDPFWTLLHTHPNHLRTPCQPCRYQRVTGARVWSRSVHPGYVQQEVHLLGGWRRAYTGWWEGAPWWVGVSFPLPRGVLRGSFSSSQRGPERLFLPVLSLKRHILSCFEPKTGTFSLFLPQKPA